MKTCCRCKQAKEPSEFGKNRSRTDGLDTACRECRSKPGADGLTDNQRWRAKNPGYQHKIGAGGLSVLQRQRLNRKTRGYHLKWAYQLSVADFRQLLVEQGYACAVCGRGNRKMVVDHDHTTGKVRSLLCYSCNTALGLLSDSAKIATAAAAYLSKHGKT